MQDNLVKTENTHPPQDNIPETKDQRNRLLAFVRDYISKSRLVAPLSLDELRRHCDNIISATGLDEKFIDYTAVILNNEVWRPTVAKIPYNKRLLLLPNCLRIKDKCPADFDQLGLVCEHCGRCLIHEVQTQAEELGYAVLIAEGSPIVMSLIESGQIETVIGVSCLAVLEKTFPYMEAAAVPGIAIPLLYDGCENTGFDLDWLWEAVYLNSDTNAAWLNFDSLKKRVNQCFEYENMVRLLPPASCQVETISYDWLCGEGKRWRPILTAGLYEAVKYECDKDDFTDELISALVAVECFHKASLIHDDIEDDDGERYGQKALHEQYGVPIALNAGDYILGIGYHLLSEMKSDPNIKCELLKIAASGHRELCIGQGKELQWTANPDVLSVEQVIDIFKQKTAPAFEVALSFGAVLADRTDIINNVIKGFSTALGIAYQVRDDMEDFKSDSNNGDIVSIRPSVMMALLWQKSNENEKTFIRDLWTKKLDITSELQQIKSLFVKYNISAEARSLLETYKTQAMQCLAAIDSTALKGFLRRIMCKIFNDIEILDCCDDYQTRND